MQERKGYFWSIQIKNTSREEEAWFGVPPEDKDKRSYYSLNMNDLVLFSTASASLAVENDIAKNGWRDEHDPQLGHMHVIFAETKEDDMKILDEKRGNLVVLKIGDNKKQQTMLGPITNPDQPASHPYLYAEELTVNGGVSFRDDHAYAEEVYYQTARQSGLARLAVLVEFKKPIDTSGEIWEQGEFNL